MNINSKIRIKRCIYIDSEEFIYTNMLNVIVTKNITITVRRGFLKNEQ